MGQEKETTEDQMFGWVWTWVWVDMGLGGLREVVMDRETWRADVNGVTESDTTEQLN